MFKTLRDAIILVAVVVLLFLQNWRSAIIPLVAVPVAIIGTFAVMAAFGFSLNNLTLFGLVLAIGIVVDDAIVVVEAVEHHIEHGLAPREATIKAMEQVSGPVIAVGLVLSAVFVPCAFISGITGQFFRQFALTICRLDDHLGVQLADAEPGADGAAAAAARQAQRRRRCRGWPLRLAGGWLGWVLLTPRAEAWLQPQGWLARWRCRIWWPSAGAVAGADRRLAAQSAAGAGRFPLFNRGFDSLGGDLHLDRRQTAARSAWSCWSSTAACWR